MSDTYIVIDCPYLCHRAHYTTGSLTHNGQATGVVFGFLRSLHTLRQELGSNKFIFCFDEGPFLRQQICPTYKKARRDKQKTMTDVERASYKNLQEQIRLLRTEYLADLGYNNVFSQQGYEADDVIAEVVTNTVPDKVIIVSADKDLYQLLTSDRVSIYEIQKRRFYTKDNFLKDYEISPNKWAAVKATAGCSSDGVAGLKGIGEKTAIKYLKGEVSRNRIAWNKLVKISDYWNKDKGESDLNLKLTSIPYPGINRFELQRDKVTQKKWDAFIKRFGLASLKEIP